MGNALDQIGNGGEYAQRPFSTVEPRPQGHSFPRPQDEFSRRTVLFQFLDFGIHVFENPSLQKCSCGLHSDVFVVP